MGGRGLESSIWAPHNHPDAHHTPAYRPRGSDWNCSSCGFSNFSSRQACYRCLVPKDGLPTVALNYVHDGFPVQGSPPNFSHSTPHGHPPPRTNRENSPPPAYPHGVDSSHKSGLATSRWAPRNRKLSATKTDGPEIWTRTVPIPLSNNPIKTSSTTSNHPDLGLPYEVQHYILAMIQRILEEACYDFASRWISKTLHDRNWSCPEAVELSSWKLVLPEALPPEAIVPVQNYTLERALTDAVRLRNSAVHRHLCDNGQIRRMAQDSQDLMYMFSDVTRQAKFEYLREELDEWEKLSRVDIESAKSRLEKGMQEISERPINDMDWTPNAVSLEEIGNDTTSESLREVGENTQYTMDEMELD